MISRCSSPMPAMIVSPVSLSVWTRNVGSSRRGCWRALPSLSLSALVLGSIDDRDDRLRERLASRMTGASASHSVSPVVASFRPMTATMSPARIASMSSRLLACIWKMRPILSLLPLVALSDRGAGLSACRSRRGRRSACRSRSVDDLERQRRERLVVLGVALDDLLVVLASSPLTAGCRAGTAGSRRRRRAWAGRPCS